MLRCVITGGPCGGKTKIMSHLTERLEERGYKVFVVPETATELIMNGIVPGDKIPDDVFQGLVMDKQLSKESLYEKAASFYGDKSVIFYDRGLLDAKAYVSESTYDSLLSERGMNMQDVYGHYDTVLHMRTAADGAEEFYQWNDPSKEDVGNNAARSESPEGARIKDSKTVRAWIGHPHLRVFDNSTDFEGKIDRVTEEVFAELGEPVPKEIERKFLIEKPDAAVLKQLGFISRQQITQTYLFSDTPDTECRVRQRGTKQDGFSFYYTEKTKVGEGERLEKEARITESEYIAYLTSADTSLHPVVKTRSCFVYQNQYLEMDEYGPNGPIPENQAILEVELNHIDDKILLPEGLRVISEVTFDPNYYNRSFAEPKQAVKREQGPQKPDSYQKRVEQAQGILQDFSEESEEQCEF